MSDELARLEALQTGRNILLQAPAGSGKTTVLAQRFLSSLARVDEPEQVLAITFTRKAAAEMRERVLLALEGGLPESQADLARWQDLAAQVHAHARRRGWQAAELPARLRIQTIDSLAHEIARAMPLLGRMYSSLKVVDAAGPLYMEAAREALRFGTTDADYREDTDRLLARLDNDWDRAQQLLAELLPGRNRWQPVLIQHQPQELAERVSASLRRIAQETIAEAQRILRPDLVAEAAMLACDSARHRRDAGHAADGAWSVWLQPDASLAATATNLSAWQAVTALVLKHDGDPRRQININQGFPRDDKPLKQRWQLWMQQLQERAGAMQVLQAIEALPPLTIDAEERGALAALARLMLLAAMQLKLVFREHGLVDHSEVSAVARQALRGMDGPTDQSIRQTLRVQHLLVDEFQDTSPEQLDLVRDLIGGWDSGDERSLFLVGDPMQSIYLFRNSEVGLFLRTRAQGIGDIQLEARHLSRNFRSLPPLVEWANNAFRAVFPPLENLRSSAVPFLPAQAARRAGAESAAAVVVWPQPGADPDAEAFAIAQEILVLRNSQPVCSIAVLVQTRALAAPVLRALREAGIVTLGVDLAMLADRSVVRDLVALGQALLDAGDRSAWLAVLRAPYCGLTLADLQLLCDGAGRQPLVEFLTEVELLAQMSADGQMRLARVGPQLLRAWHARGNSDVATAIETLWHELGGTDACQDAAEISAARQYLLALRRLQEQEGSIAGAQLQQLAEQLRDRSEVAGEHAVEVLTIHHAKGLEWDVVFVPGLGKSARADTPPLLRWLQLPAESGDNDLLLAVHSIGEPNSSNPLARYIARLQAERQQNERVRLLYVAVTRARQRLYLSGHAPWRESQAAAVPSSRSLLHLLWPAVHDQFAGLTPASDDAPGSEQSLESVWLRVPADFAGPNARPLPVVSSLTRGATAASTEPVFSWVGPLARAAGTVMHAEFERLAAIGPVAAEQSESRLEPCAARLREQGVAPDQAMQTAAAIVVQLRLLMADSRVQWLVSEPHRDAHSELRLSGIVAGELRNVVIDRSFVDGSGTRWIIDYKTSVHAGGGLDEFLAREMERYAPQLRLYLALAKHLGPEPVRAALYFPWLREFREFDLT
ncbi:MAG: UvrD-helicase domain-containing protein [Steroidobacteraceae bacterium]